MSVDKENVRNYLNALLEALDKFVVLDFNVTTDHDLFPIHEGNLSCFVQGESRHNIRIVVEGKQHSDGKRSRTYEVFDTVGKTHHIYADGVDAAADKIYFYLNDKSVAVFHKDKIVGYA